MGGGFDSDEETALVPLAATTEQDSPIWTGADVSGGLAGAPIGWRVAVRSNQKLEERSSKVAAICVPEPGALASGAAALLALAAARRRRR